MSEADKILLRTNWERGARGGSHHPTRGTIDDVNPKGPRFKIHSPRGNSVYIRANWSELNFSWKPADRQSEKQFDLWEVARKAEFLNSLLEKEEQKVTVPVLDDEMVECSSVYHLPRHGKIKKTEGYQTRKFNNWVCYSCKAKREAYSAKQNQRKKASRQVASVPTPEAEVILAEYVQSPNGLVEVERLPEWKITIIQPTVITVRAKDFLEAAAMVSEKGEIIKVERL